jgi:hypothetical protein
MDRTSFDEKPLTSQSAELAKSSIFFLGCARMERVDFPARKIPIYRLGSPVNRSGSQATSFPWNFAAGSLFIR